MASTVKAFSCAGAVVIAHSATPANKPANAEASSFPESATRLRNRVSSSRLRLALCSFTNALAASSAPASSTPETPETPHGASANDARRLAPSAANT